MENQSFSFPVKMPYEIIKNYNDSHDGIDITGEGYNTSILASNDGVVVDTSYNVVRGNYVVIKHTNNIYTLYSHLSRIDIKLQANVSKGSKIGTMGSTGNATSLKLHFSIFEGEPYNGGKPIDPFKFIKQK